MSRRADLSCRNALVGGSSRVHINNVKVISSFGWVTVSTCSLPTALHTTTALRAQAMTAPLTVGGRG